MPHRRIMCIWFPRLGAERLLRLERQTIEAPFAVVQDDAQRQVLWSLCAAASIMGLQRGQPLRDAQAMCPSLRTRRRNLHAEQRFLRTLGRWAGKFSPWVALEDPDSLMMDITGCAHLFGGEGALTDQMITECTALGLNAQIGLADTKGAAWALAHYGKGSAPHDRSGDAIDQEARATRSRAAKRRRRSPDMPPEAGDRALKSHHIAPAGSAHSALRELPVAALRITPALTATLNRLGLRHIGELSGQPRAALARRFGKALVQRLDQALGSTHEPICPLRAPTCFAVRLSLPEPIGLRDDIIAALDRLLPRLCMHLKAQSQGARHIRLEAFRSDATMDSIEIGLARPGDTPERIRPVLIMKLDSLEAGFGIDLLRLEATRTEALHSTVLTGQLGAGQHTVQQQANPHRIADLIGQLGAKIGLERITRHHPANSHIPEKSHQTLAAAWSEPVKKWPLPRLKRPVVLWRPEPINGFQKMQVSAPFHWRGRQMTVMVSHGPERIAPEWWLEDPNWRSGVRDYWQVSCAQGDQLWLFFAHGAAISGGWFCHGSFT
ncbi:MAG: DNA polymerase Y family protein [Paracoccaceae bacterium]|nr:DNA polymerase Y family protein [Paracoccaceae bacterium]